MATWFNYTYGVGIQLNINCTFNVDRVLFVSEFHALYIGSIYLDTVIHSNIHVVRLYYFFLFFFNFFILSRRLTWYSCLISSALI